MKKIKNLLGLMIIGLSLIFTSCSNVEPTEEGFIYRPYTSGIDTTETYNGTTEAVAPWNSMIKYNILQQSRNYTSSVMDKNGTEITVIVSINYNPMKGRTSKLHTTHGLGYEESFVDVKVKGAIKNVIGRYTYEEVYSTHREALETEIDDMLSTEFHDNFITYNFCEIADVNLPKNISEEIVNKETQKQRNLTAFEKKVEEMNLANARIEKARGDSSLLISANFEASSIEVISKQLAKSKDYIDYTRWNKWDGVGSPWGSGNVYGDKAVTILKQ